VHPSKLNIEVEGSAGDRYQIELHRKGDELKTSCSCQAGRKNVHCKHRLALLAGDFSRVRDAPPVNLDQAVTAMLQGTPLQATLKALASAEQEASRAKNELNRVKKSLDRVMHE
jgi:hypothetical protein